ncbi:hypothetical protein M3M33_13870, partial [Loigolactobacillus coryniformis]|uniref:hypothetical protein n=1 Tax=Loigolactobacillus coryniformis TaxID=1610 RepID=UPI00387E641F|nr:hypothetical protein [Loigolactobacillus coryniformis]
DNHRVRKIDVNTKIMSTIVGDGYEGFRGDGGLAKNASLNFPMGICIDTNNNLLFIADTYNYVIRRVNMSTNIIQTIAGQANVPGFAGDGSSA